MSGAVVVGIGNAFRHDDGVGLAVATAARRSAPPGVRIVELDGEPARLVDAWTGADVAVIVDAARSGEPAGTVRRLEADEDLGSATSTTSTHAYSVRDAIALGRALDRLPARLVIVAVEGSDFSEGPGLTEAVGDAVPEAVALVLDELARSTHLPVPGKGLP